MDDELFSLPTLHNDFGVPPWCETTPIPEFGPPISLMAALYDQSMPVPDFINFIPDDGSLASAASLMTPTQPSAFPFLSTYSATSSLITPLDSSASPAVQDKELREYHELPKGKEGPIRVGKRRTRQAPYHVDRGEGAKKKKNKLSQQTPSEIGYEFVPYVPGSSTKRKKPFCRNSPDANREITTDKGSNRVGALPTTQSTHCDPSPPPPVTPPTCKSTTCIIRRQARLKDRSFTFVTEEEGYQWVNV